MFGPNSRFLVVDDFKTMRTIVKNILSKIGYSQFEEAEDGAIGFAALEKSYQEGKPFDCIICDWNMPNMSGLDFLKKVRTHATYKFIPFVLVTAENEQKQVIEAAKAGVSSYIVKPFVPADFETKLLATYNKHYPKKAS